MGLIAALWKSSVLAICLAGLAAGYWVVSAHLASDPLVDVHAYYDAGARLNAGLPLYQPSGDVDAPGFYRYPPLLAIAFRPLALLPFGTAALIWEAIVVVSLVATIWVIRPRGRTALLAAALGFPLGFAVAIGQAQIPVMMLIAVANPWSIALAANLKLMPALVALYWIGRRDVGQLRSFGAWCALLLLFQLVLEPHGTLAFLTYTNLAQVGHVQNWSPYAVSPALWLAFVLAGAAVTLLAARTRYGWPVAVVYSIVATPRLLIYMFGSAVAAARSTGSADAVRSVALVRDETRTTAAQIAVDTQ